MIFKKLCWLQSAYCLDENRLGFVQPACAHIFIGYDCLRAGT